MGFGGMIMIITSLFVMYTSIIYNNAIAVTDTDLIANAVIILFVTDLDEMILSIMVVLYPDLFPKDDFPEVIKEEVNTLKSEMLQLTGKMAKVEAENVERKDTNKRSEIEMTKIRETFRDTNERSESEMTKLRETNKRFESEMTKIRETMTDLRETLRDTNERSESEMTKLRETNKCLGSEMSELRETNKRFQSKLSELCEKV